MSYTMREYFDSELCQDWNIFWYALGNFLDDFKRNPLEEKISEPPEFISLEINAFLAGVAEQLSHQYQLTVPLWVYRKEYRLKEPFFPSGLKGDYRIFVLKESPVAFKARNIFVDSDVLSRC